MKRSVINILDLSVEELDELIATANDIIANPKKYSEKCRGLKLATLFFEPSTGPGSALRRRCLSWAAMCWASRKPRRLCRQGQASPILLRPSLSTPTLGTIGPPQGGCAP